MLPSRSEDEGKRLQALQDICDCNKGDESSLRAIFDVTKKILAVESANFNLIGESCITIRRTNSCIITEGAEYPETRALCYWTLVPEDPHVMIVENMTLDARVIPPRPLLKLDVESRTFSIKHHTIPPAWQCMGSGTSQHLACKTATNALTTEPPFLRFYAAVPLVTCNKQRIGTLCLLDTKPQQFGSVRAAFLSNLAEILMWQLEGNVAQQRPASPILEGSTVRTKQVYQQACALVDISTKGWQIMYANKPLCAIAGDCTGADFWPLMQGPAGIDEALAKLQPEQFDSTQAFCVRNVRLRGQGQEAHYDLELSTVENSIPHLSIGTVLGAGDFAKVFRGMFRGEKVAVKIVKDPGEALSEGDVPLEALLVEGLKHSSVVGYKTWKMATTAAGQQRLWIVMEFCNRGTLAEAVDKGWFRTTYSHLAAPSSKTILATVRDIAAGLEYLHANKIIHCDLSGGNILLNSKEPRSSTFTAKIADFGFARQLGEDYSCALPVGNYAYLAPEVMQGEKHSQASDIWSLGVLLQEMLTGKKAWGGLNHSQIAFAVLWQKRRLEVSGEGFLPRLALLCMEVEAVARPSAAEVLLLVEEEMNLLLHPSNQPNVAVSEFV